MPLADCSTSGNCTLAVYMGFSGADRHGTTLNTASQIHQINQYSATTLYYRLTNSVCTPGAGTRLILQDIVAVISAPQQLMRHCSMMLPTITNASSCQTECTVKPPDHDQGCAQVSNILNGASSTTLGSSNTAVDSSGSVA